MSQLLVLNIPVFDIPAPMCGLPCTTRIWSLIHMTSIYPNAHDTPGTVLRSRDTGVNKRDTSTCHGALTVCSRTAGRFLYEDCSEKQKVREPRTRGSNLVMGSLLPLKHFQEGVAYSEVTVLCARSISLTS